MTEEGKVFTLGPVASIFKGIKSYDDWRTRDLSKEGYIYIWADGIYFNIRSYDKK